MFAVPLPRLIMIIVVALLLILYMVRFTSVISNCELFIDVFIRKLPLMLTFANGKIMVLFAGTLLIIISEMLTRIWLVEKSVAFAVMLYLPSGKLVVSKLAFQ